MVPTRRVRRYIGIIPLSYLTRVSTRPKPLSSGFFAFLFPPVPLVPGVPSDVSDAGESSEKDAELFPSDDQLTQRTIWVAFLIALGWSVVALAGALPLYMVNTPCQADYGNQVTYGGASAMMQDMSLLRLLRHLDAGNISTTSMLHVQSRSIAPRAFQDDAQNTRKRLIILTILAAVVILIPAMRKVIFEFNRLVNHRKAWLQTKCGNLEMGWISIKKAPGFVGWGEQELKDLIIKNDIGASLRGGSRTSRSGSKSKSSDRRQKHEASEEQPLTDHPEELSTVDIHALYTIGLEFFFLRG